MGRKNKLLIFIIAAAIFLPLISSAGYIGDYPPPLLLTSETTTEPESEPKPVSDVIAEPEYIIDADFIINNSIILKIGSPKALVSGGIKQIDENNPNVVPFIDENNRTLTPVRFIAENFGYNVDYEPQEKIITIINFNESRRIQMLIGVNFIIVNDEVFIIDTAPKITPDGRTFIPVRAFIENGLGKKLAYVSSEQIIIISDIDIGGDNSELAIEVADRLKEIFFNAPVYEELIYSEPVYNKLDSTEPVWPFDKSKVTRELKNWPTYTDGTYHAGTDFAIPLGSDIYSAYSGVVDTVKDLGAASYGKYIVIKSIIDGNVRYIYYGHLNEQMVQEGDRVMAGDKIGESGTTGYSTGPHLHYEVRNENKNHGSLDNPSLNPYDYLPKSK